MSPQAPHRFHTASTPLPQANQPRNLAAAKAEDSGDEEKEEEQLPRPAFVTILKCKVELQKAKFAERRDKVGLVSEGTRSLVEI